jgi:hypothetical protein
MRRPVAWSKTLTLFEDDWDDGNVPIMGLRTHAAWLGTSVFDAPAPLKTSLRTSICIARASFNGSLRMRQQPELDPENACPQT